MNSQLINMDAQSLGFTEGIALNTEGYVSEGSGENIFVIRDGEVLTPPLGSSVLPGITRAAIIHLCEEMNFPLVEDHIPREMLYIADEVFFTGTAAEVTPIRSVDKIAVGSGKPGPITLSLQKALFEIIDGKREDKLNLLHHYTLD